MRKQTKLAVVLAAAALLAVGSASIVSAAGWVQEGTEWRYQDNSGDYVTDTIKKSGETSFYLDENGYMAKDYFAEYNENYYYFGSNGAMVTNTWVAIDPSLVDGDDEDVDAYWYYFQATGKAYKASDNASNGVSKKTIDGKKYLFNTDGQMLTGWIDSTGDRVSTDNDDAFLDCIYFAGEDGVLREGWLAYNDGLNTTTTIGIDTDLSDRETIYFYFKSNNKKLVDSDKTINGKKYRFNDKGVMYTGWEYMEEKTDVNTNFATSPYTFYYSGKDDGHMVKKGWVYAVPSELLDSTKNDDDEEAYFYFNTNGTMVAGTQKRINGKYYVFNTKGLMKTGLVILKNGKWEDKIDLDYTDGSDFIKMDTYNNDEPNNDGTDHPGTISGKGSLLHASTREYTIHYYGADGAKVTGNKISIEFADDTYTFASKNNGGFTGYKKKKFYSNGFLLKATDDLKLGLVIASDDCARVAHDKTLILPNISWAQDSQGSRITPRDPQTDANACYVVNGSGSQKNRGAFKDSDGNYWLVATNKTLVGIYDVQVKIDTNNRVQWKADLGPGQSYIVAGQSKPGKTDGADEIWVDLEQGDKNGNKINIHKIGLTNDYCLNFELQ